MAGRPERVDVLSAPREQRIDVLASGDERERGRDAGASAEMDAVGGDYTRAVTPTRLRRGSSTDRALPARERRRRRRRPQSLASATGSDASRQASSSTTDSRDDGEEKRAREQRLRAHLERHEQRQQQQQRIQAAISESGGSSRRRARMSLSASSPRSSASHSSGLDTAGHLDSAMQLISTASSAAWRKRLNPQRDLRLLSNCFRDERLEESYQLYSSTCDFPVTRRLMLLLLVFELTAYLLFWRLADACMPPTGPDPGFPLWSTELTAQLDYQAPPAGVNLTAACISYGLDATTNDTMTALLWMFAPLAGIYGLLPLKYFEGSMRLRIGVYYIRRHWKAIATVIVLIWAVGLTIFVHHAIVKLRVNLQKSLNKGLVCPIDTVMPIEWYEQSNWLENHNGTESLDLLFWILIYDSKLTYSLVMGVLAVSASFGGIVAVAMKLNFPHVLVLSVAQWLATAGLILFGPPMSVNSRTVHNVGNQTVLFFLCVFIPTCFTLMATYSEDRAARMAYASKVHAERINTTLKLDLSVKQIGLENRSVTGDEKEAMQRALDNASGNMQVLNSVAIPFDDLKLKEIIAKTPYGEVILGEYHSTCVVVKRLALACLTADGFADFKTKVELLASLRHPNIVLFIGATFDNLSNVGLVLEYLERGDVLSLLRSPIALTWSDPLLKIATDVAQGAAYLHNCDPPLAHRDLKSSNLLCTPTYSCKISDFGESKRQSMSGRLFSTIVGTPYWLAPEILREEKYDTQVDCYSFGVILIELETRRDPYYDLKSHSTIDIMLRVARGELRPSIPRTCNPCRRELILRCLDNDPVRRPKMTEILFALQHEVRQELVQDSELDGMRDKRRMMMKRHKRLNEAAVQELLQ